MKKIIKRPRRLRLNNNIRNLVRETGISVRDVIYPLFIVPGEKVKKEVSSMPGVYQMSIDVIVEECKQVKKLGIPGVILFGVPDEKDKDSVGTGAFDNDGIIQKAIRAIKKDVKDLLVIADLCFCEFTDHGHCGVIDGHDVENDQTLENIYKTAVSQAESGADIIAPSGMMDGMVRTIRDGLDSNGFTDVLILSYSAKYSSAYYGPFRDAAESAPSFGDRQTYQMDYHNLDEAVREVELDIEEGADIVMVKPALSYMDVIHKIKSEFNTPVAAYNVSGEYSMIKAAAMKGWIDEKKVVIETLSSMKRAGANFILTYFAKDLANYLKETN